METVALRDVALSLQDGPFGSNLKSSHYVDHGVRVIRLQNIGPGYFDDRDRAFVTGEHFALLRKHECRPGDVLIATLGDPIVRACLQPPWLETALQKADCLRLRCDPDQVVPEYIARFLNSDALQSQAKALAHGQTRPRVNLGQLGTVRVPLPPLAEQHRIADILDHADAIRSKRQQSIGQVDDLARAIFLDMFGSLDQFTGRWVKVTDLAATGDAIRTGPFGSQLLHSEFQSEGIAVLGIDSAVTNEFRWIDGRCISDAKYRQLKRYTVRSGDVLITIMGTCGRCAVVPDGLPPAINTKHLCCITLEKTKCLPEFLHAYFLWHPVARRYLQRAAKGAIMSGLNMGIIKALPVPVVPLGDQASFVARQKTYQRLRATLRSSLAGLDQLFASLQQRAFTGTL